MSLPLALFATQFVLLFSPFFILSAHLNMIITVQTTKVYCHKYCHCHRTIKQDFNMRLFPRVDYKTVSTLVNAVVRSEQQGLQLGLWRPTRKSIPINQKVTKVVNEIFRLCSQTIFPFLSKRQHSVHTSRFHTNFMNLNTTT